MSRTNVVVMNALSKRTNRSIATGGDGFIPTGTLSFDAGLNTRAIRRVLDQALIMGVVERRYNGPGASYSYRVVEGKCF